MLIQFVLDVCKAFPFKGAKSVKTGESRELQENRMTSLLVFSTFVSLFLVALSLALVLTDVGRFVLSVCAYICLGAVAIILFVAMFSFLYRALSGAIESYLAAFSLMAAGMTAVLLLIVVLLLTLELGRQFISVLIYCIFGGVAFLMIMLFAGCCIELVRHYEEYKLRHQ